MPDRIQMAHLEIKRGRGRFRLRFPTTYEAMGIILALGCLVKDVPPEAWAALASMVR